MFVSLLNLPCTFLIYFVDVNRYRSQTVRGHKEYYVCIVYYKKVGIKSQRIRAKSLTAIIALKSHILDDKKKSGFEIDEAVFFTFCYYYFFLPFFSFCCGDVSASANKSVCVCQYSLVLLLTISSIFAFFIFVWLWLILIAPSITFIEPFLIFRFKQPSNRIVLYRYEIVWGFFSSRNTKLPRVMNMSIWFVFTQWIDNNVVRKWGLCKRNLFVECKHFSDLTG